MIMSTTRFTERRQFARSTRLRRAIVSLVLLFAGLLVATQSLMAETGGPYTIVRSAVATAATAQASPYRADATVGQTAIGLQSGGAYDVGGGFWGSMTPVVSLPETPGATLYLPAITR